MSRAISARVQLEIEESIYYFSEIYRRAAALVIKKRQEARSAAIELLSATNNLREINSAVLQEHPETISALRTACLPMYTCSTLACLTGTPRNRLQALERGEMPGQRAAKERLTGNVIPEIARVLSSSIDTDLAPWLAANREPSQDEVERFVTAVSEREAAIFWNSPSFTYKLERIYFDELDRWLNKHGYTLAAIPEDPYTYSTHHNYVDVTGRDGETRSVRIKLSTSNFAYSSRMQERLLMETSDDPKERPIYILAGYQDTPFIEALNKAEIPYVWAHDLDALAEHGL